MKLYLLGFCIFIMALCDQGLAGIGSDGVQSFSDTTNQANTNDVQSFTIYEDGLLDSNVSVEPISNSLGASSIEDTGYLYPQNDQLQSTTTSGDETQSSAVSNPLSLAPQINGPYVDKTDPTSVGLTIPSAESFQPDSDLDFQPAVIPTGLTKPITEYYGWYWPESDVSKNKFYVQTSTGLGTVAGCKFSGYIPLWADVASSNNLFSYEWYAGRPYPTVKWWGWNWAGPKKSWFYGDVEGWHILAYNCREWSNYVYIYVWPQYSTSYTGTGSQGDGYGSTSYTGTGSQSVGYSGTSYTGTGSQSDGYSGTSYAGTGSQSVGYSGTSYTGTGSQGIGYGSTSYAGTDYQGSGYGSTSYTGTGYQGSGYGSTSYTGTGYQGSGYGSTSYTGTGYQGSGYGSTSYTGTGYQGSGYGSTSYTGTGYQGLSNVKFTLPNGAPTPPNLQNEQIVLPKYDQLYPQSSQNWATRSTSQTCSSSSCQIYKGAAVFPGTTSCNYQTTSVQSSSCNCNKYYVQVWMNNLTTAAGVKCGEWIPLWSKIGSSGVYWSYEWAPCGGFPQGFYCQPQVKNFGYKGQGWYSSVFYGNTVGWHILSYNTGDWSNYIYIYVWPYQ